MTANTKIEWADHTFNPWWGCTKVGPGCDHCYAEAFDKRVGGAHWGPGAPRRLIKDWSGPRKWNREAERTGYRPWVFCASMADVFDNEAPPEWRERLWDVVRDTPYLRWIFVTKRIGNVEKMVPADWPFLNAGLVITTVNQDEADRDVPKLLKTKARWRGISAEPLLGEIDFTRIECSMGGDMGLKNALTGEFWIPGAGSISSTTLRGGPKLDWIAVGGESGPNARPMHPDWARSIRHQCKVAGTAFFFKQHGTWGLADTGDPDAHWIAEDGSRFSGESYDPPFAKKPGMRSWALMKRVGKKSAGRLLDGREWNEMPEAVST